MECLPMVNRFHNSPNADGRQPTAAVTGSRDSPRRAGWHRRGSPAGEGGDKIFDFAWQDMSHEGQSLQVTLLRRHAELPYEDHSRTGI